MSERITVLIDHNIEWQASLLWNTLATEGWLELYPIDMVMFEDADLDIRSNEYACFPACCNDKQTGKYNKRSGIS